MVQGTIGMFRDHRHPKVVVDMTYQFGRMVPNIVQRLVEDFIVLNRSGIGHNDTQQQIFVGHVFDSDRVVQVAQVQFAGQTSQLHNARKTD